MKDSGTRIIGRILQRKTMKIFELSLFKLKRKYKRNWEIAKNACANMPKFTITQR